MKRFAMLILAAAAFVSFSAPAFAGEDYSKIMFDKPLFLLKLDIAGLFDSPIYKNYNVGPIAEARKEFFAEVAKRTGLSPETDLKTLVIVVGESIDPKASAPNKIGVFVTGKFSPEKTFAALEKDPDASKFVSRDGGKAFFKFDKPGIKGGYHGDNMLIVGSEDVITAVTCDGFKGAALSAEMTRMLDSSSFFMHIETARPEGNNIVAGLLKTAPPNLRGMIEKMVAIEAFDTPAAFNLKFSFTDPTAPPALYAVYNQARGLAEMMLVTEQQKAAEKLRKASTFNLIASEDAAKRIAIAAVRELLKTLEFETLKNDALIKISTPESLKKFMSPHAVPVLIAFTGIAAAIAVPNFKKARTTAQKRACMANMRVLEGAVELMWMDEGEKARPDVGTLLEKKYLKNEPKCPSGGSYKIEFGDKPENLGIECSNHGELEDIDHSAEKNGGVK